MSVLTELELEAMEDDLSASHVRALVAEVRSFRSETNSLREKLDRARYGLHRLTKAEAMTGKPYPGNDEMTTRREFARYYLETTEPRGNNMNNTTHTSGAIASAEDLQAFVDRIAYVRCHMAAGEAAMFDKLTGYPNIPTRRKPTGNLVVEFLDPATFMNGFSYEGFGATVTAYDAHSHPTPATGEVTFIRGESGEWLLRLDYEDPNGDRQEWLRTPIEEVERIVVL